MISKCVRDFVVEIVMEDNDLDNMTKGNPIYVSVKPTDVLIGFNKQKSWESVVWDYLSGSGLPTHDENVRSFGKDRIVLVFNDFRLRLIRKYKFYQWNVMSNPTYLYNVRLGFDHEEELVF